MRLVNIINNYFSVTDPRFSVSLLTEIATIIVLFLILSLRKPRWFKIGYFVLFVLLLRCLLFGNQFSWGLYYQQLTVDEVGWRQQSVINVEYYKFFKYPGKKYLAVGSSQTYVMYQDYSKKHNNITVINLAGMTPIDFFLYRKYITARKPEYVLLYLSEFDLAKEPSLPAARSDPPQGLDFLRQLPVYWELSKTAHKERELKEMMVMELFPEYKYSFVFKGLVQKLMKKNEALGIQSLYEKLHPDSEELKKEIGGTLEQMDGRWIKYQVYFLREFFEYCRDKHFKVVIIEGQYNPLVRNESTARLNDLTRVEIAKLLKEFNEVGYIPTADTMPLLASDFDDAVHVKKESALRYVPTLLNKLEAMYTTGSEKK